MNLRVPRELTLGIVISVTVLVGVVFMLLAGMLQGMDYWLYSVCYKLRGERAAPEQIIIVSIDTDSMSELGPWPWPLDVHARLLRQLDAAGASVIVFDFKELAVLRAATAPAPGHEQFKAALAGSKCGTVLPFFIEEGTEADAGEKLKCLQEHALGTGRTPRHANLYPGRLLLPDADLQEACDGVGCLNVYQDRDLILRAVPTMVSYEDTLLPSLALESYRQFISVSRGSINRRTDTISVGDKTFPLLPSAEALVNFYGGYDHFRRASYSRVLKEPSDRLREQFANKLVLVAPPFGTGTGLFRTPAGALLPGAEVNANIIGNLLDGSVIRKAPLWAVIVLMAALTLLLSLTLPAAGVFRGTSVSVVVFALCFGLIFWRFTHNVWFPMAGPMLCIVLIGSALVIRSAAISDWLRTEANIRLQSRLQAITGVGRLIDSSLEREGLLNEIMRWVEAELDVEAASLLLLDERTKRLRFEVALGEKGDAVKDFTLALGEGIVGKVAQTGEPLMVNSAMDDPRSHPDIAKAIDYPVHNALCVPMFLRGEVIGVIEVMNKTNRMPFTDYDSALLTVISQQAGLFLENARLYSILQHRVDYANAELRGANQELASEKAKVDTMVQEMVDGVIATDEADRIVLLNEAAERMLGISAREAMGEPVLATIRQPDLVRLWAMPLSPHGGSYTEEVEIGTDKSLALQVTVALVGSAEEIAGKCMILTDVTEFKQIDQLKTDLIGFVSHELKTPLTNIGLYTELVRDTVGAQEEKAAELVNVIGRQTIRMQHMVEDFLNVSRIEANRGLAMNTVRFDGLRPMIEDAVAIEGHGRDTHRFEIELPEPPPSLWVDRTKLEEILANLIGNAIKYSPNGGLVRIAAEVEDGMAHFSVSDEGVGISEADRAHLFQRFQRIGSSVSRVPGTGLGLFVCKHLVEAHGGRIWFESTQGEGSTFRFTLPVYSHQDQEDADEQGSEA